MTKTLFMQRALILTHAEWCRWLLSRGCLAPTHRRCAQADRCRALDLPVAEWRYQRREA